MGQEASRCHVIGTGLEYLKVGAPNVVTHARPRGEQARAHRCSGRSGAPQRIADHLRSRFLLISSLNFRISSNVLRGFSDDPGEVAVL
jgi:hypothetical protein